MFMSPGYWDTSVFDRYASEAPICTVPVAADEIPVPDPVAAVVTAIFGNFAFAPVTQRLNSGYSKLDPVSSKDTDDVGAFASRLCSVAPGPVVAVVLFVGALVVGDELFELHAASDTATTPMVKRTPALGDFVRRDRTPTVFAFSDSSFVPSLIMGSFRVCVSQLSRSAR
jgi:hypothetical protein